MIETLQDLREEARLKLNNNNLIGALKIYRLLLEAVPLDFDLRFEIADIYKNIGDIKNSTAIYSTIARHCINAGDSLAALVAIKLLEEASINTNSLIEEFADKYSKDSPILGRGIRPAPVDYDQKVRSALDLDYPMEDDKVRQSLAQMAAYADNIKKYPKIIPPIAILSTLDKNSFLRLTALMGLKRFKDSQNVVIEGEKGESVYFIARGIVKVTKKAGNLPEEGQIVLAKLGPGSIFGEMALISDDPRGATVTCEGTVDLFELTRSQVEALQSEIKVVEGAMARFTRERLIANLFATNPIFKPFDAESKKQLLSRFIGHGVPEGTIFIQQGKPGDGLYLILQGKAEVLTWNGSEYIQVAALGTGDVAGEISLIHEEPASATVRTTTKAVLLFLSRELFYPLVEAVPDLLANLAKLANSRIKDTQDKLKEDSFAKGEGIEELLENDDEAIDDLSDDDLIMI